MIELNIGPEIRSGTMLMGLYPFPECRSISEAVEIISSRYRELAFELHPDRTGIHDSSMAELNETYGNLKAIVQLHPNEFWKEIKSTFKPSESLSSFELYKEASREFTEALERYFKRNDAIVNLNPNAEEYVNLCVQLKGIRKKLLHSIEKEPGSVFNQDAVEKIRRINIWLGK